jgi:hypothetical protein
MFLKRRKKYSSADKLLSELVDLLLEKAAKRDTRDDAPIELLNELIRQIPKRTGRFKRPDEDTITAYVLGYASDKQKRHMQQSLINSREFCREILSLLSDIDKIGSKESQHKFDACKVPKIMIPDYVIQPKPSLRPAVPKLIDKNIVKKYKSNVFNKIRELQKVITGIFTG